MGDVAHVGGKNASLGEMIQFLEPKGINIPDGFVVTAAAYRFFLKEAGLTAFIKKTLRGLDTRNLSDLARRGSAVRTAIKKAEFPNVLREEIARGYSALEKRYGRGVDVAVRSSATAEDLPGASFAGQHETFLNIQGVAGVSEAIRAAMASLFTNRAISYRVDKGFDHFKVALSVGVQKMVRSDLGVSGVLFTLDTESGFKDVVFMDGAWGLGELVVQGEVTPDEFKVFKGTLKNHRPLIGKQLGTKSRKMIYSKGKGIKRTKIVSTSERERSSFVLSDDEVLQLARWGVAIEEHYTKLHKRWTPMDIEWAKDGKTGELFIVQARPETVHSLRDFSKVREYELTEKKQALLRGAAVGSTIAVGKARVIMDAKDIKQFKKGEVLVTDMTDPDWEPIMKIASAIVTDKGGRTSHAAIVSRELGIPCVVGTERATRAIKTGETLTVDTSGSDGLVFRGALQFRVEEHNVKRIPKTKTKVMMNIATPETAFEKSFLPNAGVGLAREEFIIASSIGIHPMALLGDGKKGADDARLQKRIRERIRGWKNGKEYYVDKLSFGIAMIAAAFYPKPVIVRFSDFKTNEYRTLIGGDLYEPSEENPMIGWRGASRYYHPAFAPAFALEVQALKKVREEMGLTNVIPMIPFCRTPEEGRRVLKTMEKHGLSRKRDKTLKVYVMCEIPSNVVLADAFLDIFDGMSIGSNDLTQLTVGIDRDASELVRGIANEDDPAVRELIAQAIRAARRRGKYIGICGQAPSDIPGFSEFLVKEGIESISLNPDVVVKTIMRIAKSERSKSGRRRNMKT